MTVLFMAVSLVIGCVNRMCQSFLSDCVFTLFSFYFIFVFFNHSFWPCRYGALAFLACGR